MENIDVTAPVINRPNRPTMKVKRIEDSVIDVIYVDRFNPKYHEKIVEAQVVKPVAPVPPIKAATPQEQASAKMVPPPATA